MHLENSQTSKMELSLGNRERLKSAGYSRKKTPSDTDGSPIKKTDDDTDNKKTSTLT